MTKIYHITHILLQSKHRFLINLIIYSLLIYVYNIYIDKTIISECMMRSSTPSSPEATSDIICSLQKENESLKEHVKLLNQEIIRLNDLRIAENKEHDTAIQIFEDNQRYLIADNRRLKAQLLETNENLGVMAGDNIDLRGKLSLQKEYIMGVRRNLEIAEKRIEELSTDLINIDKTKF